MASPETTKTSTAISAIWLRRVGDHAIVAVEIDGKWRDVITEFIDCPFSHIAEASRIRDAKETPLG